MASDRRTTEPTLAVDHLLVTDWRGFHSELRRAAVAATQTGAPMSLLMLEPAGLAQIDRQHGPEAVAGLVGALAGLVRTAVGERGALARYTEEQLAVVLRETNLSDALDRAERIGRGLAHRRGAGAEGIAPEAATAIGVAQFHVDESLGHLIQRAADALGRARLDRGLRVVADCGAPRRRAVGRCGKLALACPCRLCRQ